MSTKRTYEMAAKKSVSMPQILLDDAEARRQEKRLSTFSDYIQWLIRQDLEASGRHHASMPQVHAV